MTEKVSRKQQILQSLATMLEQSPGERITTSRLARQVGVSEAALYRHFPSKAKMFEALIAFIEDTIFSRVNRINDEGLNARDRCGQTLFLLLSFADKNPGITRILTGEPLSGETDRLRARVQQFFERLETQLRQFLREAEIRDGQAPSMDTTAAANMMLATAEGKISQYVRSEFNRSPMENWEPQWDILCHCIFDHASHDDTTPAAVT